MIQEKLLKLKELISISANQLVNKGISAESQEGMLKLTSKVDNIPLSYGSMTKVVDINNISLLEQLFI